MPGNFASYCRTVEAKRTSNRKKKGENNSKCGNKYLAWAFVEAANFARRYDAQCRKWFDRKAAKTSNVIATKALACKLAKAAWYLMAEGTDYDPHECLGNRQQRNENLNFGARPSASEGVGLEPSGLIGGGRAPLTLQRSGTA